MSNIEPEAVEAYQAHLKTEHEMTALALFAGGFTAGRAAAAPAQGPATEEMLELCWDTIDRQWLNAPSLELCHKFLAEHGRSYPTVGTTAPVLSSLRADLKVKKTPDVDE